MSTRAERKKRANRSLDRNGCHQCGKPGPHFVPPSFGAPGFYICASNSNQENA